MIPKIWFEKQKLENVRSLLNHYFSKFNNVENKNFGRIQNMSPFRNGCEKTDPSTHQGSVTKQEEFNHAR